MLRQRRRADQAAATGRSGGHAPRHKSGWRRRARSTESSKQDSAGPAQPVHDLKQRARQIFAAEIQGERVRGRPSIGRRRHHQKIGILRIGAEQHEAHGRTPNCAAPSKTPAQSRCTSRRAAAIAGNKAWPGRRRREIPRRPARRSASSQCRAPTAARRTRPARSGYPTSSRRTRTCRQPARTSRR